MEQARRKPECRRAVRARRSGLRSGPAGDRGHGGAIPRAGAAPGRRAGAAGSAHTPTRPARPRESRTRAWRRTRATADNRQRPRSPRRGARARPVRSAEARMPLRVAGAARGERLAKLDQRGRVRVGSDHQVTVAAASRQSRPGRRCSPPRRPGEPPRGRARGAGGARAAGTASRPDGGARSGPARASQPPSPLRASASTSS